MRLVAIWASGAQTPAAVQHSPIFRSALTPFSFHTFVCCIRLVYSSRLLFLFLPFGSSSPLLIVPDYVYLVFDVYLIIRFSYHIYI